QAYNEVQRMAMTLRVLHTFPQRQPYSAEINGMDECRRLVRLGNTDEDEGYTNEVRPCYVSQIGEIHAIWMKSVGSFTTSAMNAINSVARMTTNVVNTRTCS